MALGSEPVGVQAIPRWPPLRAIWAQLSLPLRDLSFPRAIHGTPITTFICAETHCSVSLSGLVHGCGQCIAGVARRDLEPALCFDCLESTGDSVTMGLCLLVQFTGRLVALRESSSPSTSVRHVGRRFSPYPYSIFYYKSGCDASDPSLPGPSLLAPLVHRSCLLLLPSINSMPCIPSKRARVLALHLSLPGRWPAPALGMRHSRAGTAVAQRFDFVARRFDFCAGHGNLFFLPPTLRRRGSAQGVSAAGSLPPLLALDWPSCWPFGQALARPFVCARVVVFYNYFGRSWFC